MKQFLQNLTAEFLNEAKSSPRMFEDLAAMEHYMAESYDGRAFVEILQNADDALATSVIIFACGNDFVIANNGRPFTKEDLTAICRSGASSKRRGFGIGYRGIGFKSATSISTEIVIYSSDVFFTFSKTRCAKEMNRDVDRVPTVRIPFLIEADHVGTELVDAITKFEKNGYTTFFIFKDGNREKLLTELSDISSEWLLFLNHIGCVEVELGNHLSKKVEIKRSPHGKDQFLCTDKDNGKSWLIVYGKNNTAIAFLYDQHIVPCGNDESFFHCYLPTMDSVGYPFKANADFSTDPSRKHIIVNDGDTKRSLEKIAHLIVDLLSDPHFEEQAYLINLIGINSGLSEASSFMERKILFMLRTQRWIPLRDGRKVPTTEHKIVPPWFDVDSRKKVFSYVPVLGSDEVKPEVVHVAHNMDELLQRCGCQLYGTSEYEMILTNIDAVSALKDLFLGKLWGYTLRSVLYAQTSIGPLFLKDRTGRISAFDDINVPVDFSEDFRAGIRGVLNDDELITINSLTPFKDIGTVTISAKKKGALTNRNKPQHKVEYSRWKTPIQNCMVSEQLQGRSPKDVSKKALGYDIESTDKHGNVRYLSVKTVDALGNAFILSEKEYACSERLSTSYGVYVIENGNPENNMLIEDMTSVSFEKRVREWEWISGKYEVIKQIQPDQELTIDSTFVQEFSLKYLNRIQIALLKAICESSIEVFENEYSCKATIIANQINSIVDFYIGDSIIDSNMTIKDRYVGAVRYTLKQE